MRELTAEERAEVIRAIKEQHPGAGPGADVGRGSGRNFDFYYCKMKANFLRS
jgi:hypothetical protein